jgi:hypothetical protein
LAAAIALRAPAGDALSPWPWGWTMGALGGTVSAGISSAWAIGVPTKKVQIAKKKAARRRLSWDRFIGRAI